MNSKWSGRFLDLARHIGTWSKDPSTKVGAVIVDDQRRVVGLGYNGFPRGVHDHDSRYINRKHKYQLVVHAEVNAILNSRITNGCVLICTHHPCNECAKVIIQSGISTVLCPAPSEDMLLRWGESFAVTRDMFREAGVEVEYVE